MATKDKLINLEDMKVVRDHDMAIVDNKADKVGSYPDLIAGTADQLLSSSFQTDRTPYIFRRTPYGARERGSIVGGSIVWNQLIKDEWITSGATTYGLTITNNGDGTVTVNGTVTDKSSPSTPILVYIKNALGASFFHCIKDHKYLYLAPKLPDGVSGYNVLSGSTAAMGYRQSNGSAIFNCLQTADTYAYGRLELMQNGATFNNYKYYFRVFDLTLMFGPTVADYIYAQEQATTGAGVALAKAWAGITADNDPYDAGTLKSVTGLTAHRMTDGNSDIIGEYPLDSSLTLRGIPKLDGDSIYYDGDIYPPSGEVKRRYRQMTVTGNENWSVVSNRFSIVITPQGATKASEVIVSATDFMPDTADNLYINRTTDGYIGIAVNAGRLFIIDNVNFSTKDVSAFKTYLQGLNSAGHPLTILYELAEPATETADPYTELQICDPNGTEEWAGANMPVGHDTKYYADLKGKIEDIPDAPSADGTYTLKVTVSNGVATYSWE